MNRILIAGTRSGVGKTTITMGILAVLKDTHIIQPYKVGGDYIDGQFHSVITGRKSRNLDSFFMQKNTIEYLMRKNSADADISIIEGVMGLYDGIELKKDIGSTSSIAKITNTPVILVVDGSAIAKSIVAEIKGYLDFDKDLKISAIIINNVSGEAHYNLLKDYINEYLEIEVVGYLIKNAIESLESRHLGLVPSYETENLKRYIDFLKDEISKTIEFDKILEISKTAPEIDTENINTKKISNEVNIAVAYDEAFNFYYQDNLDLLENFGATIKYFSPIRDKSLPENIHGIYLGGGFPEIFAKDLSENIEIKETILNKIKEGIPYLAECGGMMYLCDELENLEGDVYKMVGILSAKTYMTKRLQRFGYSTLTLNRDCVLGNVGDSINIHEFHRSKVELNELEKNKIETCYNIEKIRDNETIKSWVGGYKKYNGVSGYAHFPLYSKISFAENFVIKCKEFKDGKIS